MTESCLHNSPKIISCQWKHQQDTHSLTSSLTRTWGRDSSWGKTALFFSSPFSFSTLCFPLRGLGALGFLSAFGLGSLGLATRLVTGFLSAVSSFFLLPLPLVFSSGSHSSGSSSLGGLSMLHSNGVFSVTFYLHRRGCFSNGPNSVLKALKWMYLRLIICSRFLILFCSYCSPSPQHLRTEIKQIYPMATITAHIY